MQDEPACLYKLSWVSNFYINNEKDNVGIRLPIFNIKYQPLLSLPTREI